MSNPSSQSAQHAPRRASGGGPVPIRRASFQDVTVPPPSITVQLDHVDSQLDELTHSRDEANRSSQSPTAYSHANQTDANVSQGTGEGEAKWDHLVRAESSSNTSADPVVKQVETLRRMVSSLRSELQTQTSELESVSLPISEPVSAASRRTQGGDQSVGDSRGGAELAISATRSNAKETDSLAALGTIRGAIESFQQQVGQEQRQVLERIRGLSSKPAVQHATVQQPSVRQPAQRSTVGRGEVSARHELAVQLAPQRAATERARPEAASAGKPTARSVAPLPASKPLLVSKPAAPASIAKVVEPTQSNAHELSATGHSVQAKPLPLRAKPTAATPAEIATPMVVQFRAPAMQGEQRPAPLPSQSQHEAAPGVQPILRRAARVAVPQSAEEQSVESQSLPQTATESAKSIAIETKTEAAQTPWIASQATSNSEASSQVDLASPAESQVAPARRRSQLLNAAWYASVAAVVIALGLLAQRWIFQDSATPRGIETPETQPSGSQLAEPATQPSARITGILPEVIAPESGSRIADRNVVGMSYEEPIDWENEGILAVAKPDSSASSSSQNPADRQQAAPTAAEQQSSQAPTSLNVRWGTQR